MQILDSKTILNLPPALRVTIILLSGAVSILSLIIGLKFIGQADKSDWILVSLTLTQSAFAVTVVTAVLFYSQVGTPKSEVIRKSDEFLLTTLKDALGKITLQPSTEVPPKKPTVTTSTEIIDIFGRHFCITFPQGPWHFWFGLNVDRLFCIYLVEIDKSNPIYTESNQQNFANWLKNDVYAFTFGGAESVGYKANFEECTINGKDLVSIWLTVRCSDGFLLSSSEMIFWAQDIAMMTESFIRTTKRHNLKSPSDIKPQPL